MSMFPPGTGEVKLIGPDAIERALEVLLVYADDPLAAVAPDDQDTQDTLDYAVHDRAGGVG